MSEKEVGQLRAILETSPAGVSISIPDGGMVFCNRPLAAMFGIPYEEMPGRRLADHLVDPDAFPLFLEDLRRDGCVLHREMQFRRPDGKILWAVVNSQ